MTKRPTFTEIKDEAKKGLIPGDITLEYLDDCMTEAYALGVLHAMDNDEVEELVDEDFWMTKMVPGCGEE